MVATVTSFDFPVIEEMKLVSVSRQTQTIYEKLLDFDTVGQSIIQLSEGNSNFVLVR